MKTIKEITEKYLELIDKEYPRYALEQLYLWMYGVPSQKYYLEGGIIGSTLINLTEEYKDPKNNYEYDIKKLFERLRKHEKYTGLLDTLYDYGNSLDYVIIMKDAIIRLDAILHPNIKKSSKILWIYTHEDPKEYADLVEWEDKGKLEIINFSLLSQAPSGKLVERKLEAPEIKINLEENYNSDLPLSKIENFLDSSSPGLMIFNGEPGTGKSSFLKYLISEYPNKDWVVIPSKILLNCNEGAMVDYFMKDKDKIYILEDCEKLILRREKGNNLETFLNLTDGLLGDAICPKFICTFNTPLSNIDPALLRKGRLKLRYEFKTLSLEKTKKHIPEATSPMTLADIYNQEENGGILKNKRIGY